MITLIGFEDVNPEILEKINNMLQNLVKKRRKSVEIRELKVVLQRIGHEKSSRFEVNVTLDTPLGRIFTKENGYDILSTMDKIIDELDRLLVTKLKKK